MHDKYGPPWTGYYTNFGPPHQNQILFCADILIGGRGQMHVYAAMVTGHGRWAINISGTCHRVSCSRK